MKINFAGGIGRSGRLSGLLFRRPWTDFTPLFAGSKSTLIQTTVYGVMIINIWILYHLVPSLCNPSF